MRWPSCSPLAGHGNFSWALVSRTIINGDNRAGTTYLLYFLSDVLELPDPDEALTILVFIHFGSCAAASWFGGPLTDRFNSRRFFVVPSGGAPQTVTPSIL